MKGKLLREHGRQLLAIVICNGASEMLGDKPEGRFQSYYMGSPCGERRAPTPTSCLPASTQTL